MEDLIFITYGLTLIALIYGSVTDFKKREVPDSVDYGLVILACIVRSTASILDSSWTPLLEGIFGFLAFYGLGVLMFYSGQWGGGDSKMLFGMGAMIGLPLNIFAGWPFMISFLLNLVIAGAVYGALWSFILAMRNWKKVRAQFIELIEDPLLVPRKRILLCVVLLLLFVSFIGPESGKFPLYIICLIMVVTFYLFFLVRAVEIVCMHKHVLTRKLVEGDWVYREVLIGAKKIAKKGILKEKDIANIKSLAEKLHAQFLVRRGLFGATKSIPVSSMRAGDKLLAPLSYFKYKLPANTILTPKILQKLEEQWQAHQFSTPKVITKQWGLLGRKNFSETQVKAGDILTEDLYMGKYLAGPWDLGIRKDQIERLEKHHIPKVLVREGIPFVPSFLLAFIITLMYAQPLIVAFLP